MKLVDYKNRELEMGQKVRIQTDIPSENGMLYKDTIVKLNEFNDANVEYQALLQKDLQDAQLAESKEGRDLQKYANQLSSYQAEVTAKVQDFQKALEKHSINYQWYQSQYAQLKQDYNQGLQMLISGGLPQEKKENK